MSKNKPPKKKVVVTTTNKQKEANRNKKSTPAKGKKKIKPTQATRSRERRAPTQAPQEMIFGRQNYLYMGLGILLIFIGMILMSGGSMPSPEVWDEGRIYGFRRTVLAPLFILTGLGVEIYAIFKK